ncbi:MAG: hypothetical protein EB101_12385 [Chitinophagia bacterium]|nr:hypothetical protein [Chitinophagia bacterium]
MLLNSIVLAPPEPTVTVAIALNVVGTLPPYAHFMPYRLKIDPAPKFEFPLFINSIVVIAEVFFHKVIFDL